MKTVVVFYSYDGNCKFVSRQISGQLRADVVQIEPVNEKKRSKIAMLFRGVGQVMFNRKPALKPYVFDPAGYDLIILGTPVWAGSPSPALKSFLSQTKFSGKKTALFVCHGGGPGKAMDKLKNELKDNTIVSQISLQDPVKDTEKAKELIGEWVKTLNC